MTKDNLRRLIKHWMLATDILKRIEARNTCGGSGSEFEPALDSKLETILRYMDPELTPVEDSEFEPVTTDLGRAVLKPWASWKQPSGASINTPSSTGPAALSVGQASWSPNT